jgi:hypothetical protein
LGRNWKFWEEIQEKLEILGRNSGEIGVFWKIGVFKEF